MRGQSQLGLIISLMKVCSHSVSYRGQTSAPTLSPWSWCLGGAYSLMTQRRKSVVLPTANRQIQNTDSQSPAFKVTSRRKGSNNTLLIRARSKGKCPRQFAANSVIWKNSFGERKEPEEKLLKRKGQCIPCKRHVKNSSWKETIRKQVQVAD